MAGCRNLGLDFSVFSHPLIVVGLHLSENKEELKGTKQNLKEQNLSK